MRSPFGFGRLVPSSLLPAGDCSFLLLINARLLLDFVMFFEEFVEQHRIHCFVADSIRLAFFIADDQIWINLRHIFSDQPNCGDRVRV